MAVNVIITATGSLSLTGFTASTQDEVNNAAASLETTIKNVISADDVDVTSIGGMEVLARRRLQVVTKVLFTLITTGASGESADAIFDSVTGTLTNSIESGAFLTALKSNDVIFSNATVGPSTFDGYAIVTNSPTSQPTVPPTNPPTNTPSIASNSGSGSSGPGSSKAKSKKDTDKTKRSKTMKSKRTKGSRRLLFGNEEESSE
jgi:hypothetical protein